MTGHHVDSRKFQSQSRYYTTQDKCVRSGVFPADNGDVWLYCAFVSLSGGHQKVQADELQHRRPQRRRRQQQPVLAALAPDGVRGVLHDVIILKINNKY